MLRVKVREAAESTIFKSLV